jgi:hypothetical protein
MKLTIEKLEGVFAICKKENQTAVFINRRDLPFDVKQDDVLVISVDNTENWQVQIFRDSL